ncbi:MAG: GH116 family glycosyl hydrolase [Acidimicrobiales bacterium]
MPPRPPSNGGEGSLPPHGLTRRQVLSILPWGTLAAVGAAAVSEGSSGNSTRAPGDPPGSHSPYSDPPHPDPHPDPASAPRGAGSGSIFDIPSAAWKRPLGDYPLGAGGAIPQDGNPAVPLDVLTKRGVPLGGIGTGSFMLNLCGTFGPWNLDIGGDDSIGSAWGSPANSGFEQRYLSQAAFHVRIRPVPDHDTGQNDIFAVTLATEDVLSSWPRLARGDGNYQALFPKAWFTYDTLPIPVELKAVTPYVARDYRTSSLPAGIFTLAAKNTSKSHVDVSFMFSFPNAPYRMPTYQYSYPRRGLSGVAVREDGLVGVRLQATSPDNPAVTNDTEWVIAANVPEGAEATYTTGWNADGDGSDLWSVFHDHGFLPDGPLVGAEEGKAGALAVRFQIPPGEQRDVTFSLVWDFPVVQFKNPIDGTMWWKRYKQWYPGHFRGWDIARDLLTVAGSVEAGVDRWWRQIAYGREYPEWLRCASLNELYYDIFGGVFWEDGCITKPKKFGNRPGQHLYFSMESDSLRDCESFDVRHYEDIHILQLFPEIERDLLLGWGDMIMSNTLGITPHDAGSPVNDPWFVYNQYAETVADGQPMNADWLDLPSKFVLQSHAYWAHTGSATFLAEIYPPCVHTMTHLLSLDTDGDGIPDADGPCSTYDNIPFYGANIYVAVLEIGALEGMAAMAGALGDAKAAVHWKDAAILARRSVHEKLWDRSLGYFRMDSIGPHASALMSDGMCGQMHTQSGGLPDALPAWQVASHLSRVHQAAVKPFANGGMGAINIVLADGTPLGTSDESFGVWPGASYFTAALMYWAGTATGNSHLRDNALEMGYGLYRTTYENDTTAFWFSTPAVWIPGASLHWRTPAYMRNRAVWELLSAVKDPFFEKR